MTLSDLSELFVELDRDYLPHLSVNGVIFGANAGELKVLLMRWLDFEEWGLPGGFVRRDEGVDDAAARMVREHTGLEGVFLRQFHTFGGTGRGESESPLLSALRARGIESPPDHWAVSRVVSVGYVALMDFARARVVPDAMTSEYGWWGVSARPQLMLDHDEMIQRALAALRAQVDELPLSATLLPGEFTMPELQRLYETVLGRPLDRRNFQKRMLDLGLVERLPEQRPSRDSRPTYVYRWLAREAVASTRS
jgi:ADP-ribose pyrophosphatase YjhB (NUDIX family)